MRRNKTHDDRRSSAVVHLDRGIRRVSYRIRSSNKSEIGAVIGAEIKKRPEIRNNALLRTRRGLPAAESVQDE